MNWPKKLPFFLLHLLLLASLASCRCTRGINDGGSCSPSLDKEERKKYDESLRAYCDTIVVMEGQFMAGERKGREEGEKQKV